MASAATTIYSSGSENCSQVLLVKLPIPARLGPQSKHEVPSGDFAFAPRSNAGPRYPNAFFNSSFTTLGLAWPRVAFITCPTKNPRTPVLPLR